MNMDSRYFLSFILLVCSLIPSLSSLSVEAPEAPIQAEEEPRDPRQFSGFFSTPIRRAASSTRDVVKFIRDYGAFRLANSTPPDPQSTVGKRAVQLLQYVTINNIRDTINKLLNSEAAPVVANIVKNIDRDTLQLFNGPDRTYEGILGKNRTSTTTAKPTSGNRQRVRGKGTKGNGTESVSSTLATLVVETSTTKAPVLIKSGDSNNANSGNRKPQLPVQEDDEEESGEDD